MNLTDRQSASGVSETDLIHIVKTGDTTQSPYGSSYKVEIGDYKALFSGTDTYVTGGTYSNGTTIFRNNTGGTFSVTGFKTTDLVVTGGTYSTGTAIFTNNTGGTFSVSGFSTGSTGDVSYWSAGSGTNAIVTINSNNTASGDFAIAEGRATQAIGDYSHAEGNNTLAIGDYSHVEGFNNVASGISSHAEGNATQASGDYSHAEGNVTQAIGLASHAEGHGTLSTGVYSHAEGWSTHAFGSQSHAEGFQTYAGGDYSHAEGRETVANGQYSHAEGYQTQATGIYSHAEGYQTRAIGNRSHAEGSGSISSGQYSHAGGRTTASSGDTSFVHGYNSKAIGNYSIVLGRNLTGNTADTTYVDNLNIRTIPAGPGSIDIGVDANGFVVNQASDIRLKENIQTIDGALNTVQSLRGVTYNWIDREAGGNGLRYGFIAQEVQEVVPDLVTDNGEYLGVQYKDVPALLVEAIKELTAKVTELESTIIELKNK